MRKAVAAGIITGILVVLPAQGPGQSVEQVSGGEKIPPLSLGLGTFSTSRGAPGVTMENLRKAAAGGCTENARALALVDDSLSVSLLARYGWRVVTRIGDAATLAGCAATAPYLCALPGIRYVKMPSPIHTTMDSVRKIVRVNPVHMTDTGWNGPRLTGKGVLFGIIDTDFDTRHKAFLDSLGITRFDALWDQADTTPGFPNRYGYGVIKDRAGVLADSMFCLGSDGHGTLMTSFGAGSDWASPYYGIAPDVRIAGVKMGETDQTVIDGLDWLFSLADSLGLPAVVNMSLGDAEGPHDGTSLVDRAIDSVSKAGHIVVGAIGNDGNKREHVQLTVGTGGTAGTWPLTVTAGTWYASMLEMWGEPGKSMVATIYCIDSSTKLFGLPTPATRKTVNSATSSPDASPVAVVWSGTTFFVQTTAVESASALNGKPHIQLVMYSPSLTLYCGVRVSVPVTGGGTVHCWNVIQKPCTGFGVTGWYDGDTVMSLNELGGTAKRNITVGGYNSKLVYTLYNGTPAGYPPGDSSFHGLTLYSGRGPTVDGRIKPDITAPSSNPAGAMARFITSLSNCVWWPDSPAVESRYMVTGGTSVASPIVAGVVALMLEYDHTLTPETARQIIMETAINDAATGPIGTAYNNLWGAGKVNALGAVDRLINGTRIRPPEVTAGAAVPARLVLLSGSRLRFTGSAKGVTIELFSLLGRLVMRQADNDIVPLARLPQGAYFARAVEKGKVISSRKVSVLH